MITRRHLLASATAGLAALPLAGRAQQVNLPVVGFLNPRSPERAADVVAAFRSGLAEAGYIEGKNVLVEYRWAQDQNDRLPALAGELAGRPVKVIVAGATTSARAAIATTNSIPIVFTTALDPVQLGLVASLARPGGNVTGVTFFSTVLVPKQLELLHELVPGATIVGLLINPSSPSGGVSASLARPAARALGLELQVMDAQNETELSAVFARMAEQKIGALLLGVEPFFDSRPERVVALATRYALPTVYYAREFVHAGGLISYGASLLDAYRRAGAYAGRILKGAKPAELPILQPTKFEMAINLKIAKELGLTVPAAVLARADEIIE